MIRSPLNDPHRLCQCCVQLVPEVSCHGDLRTPSDGCFCWRKAVSSLVNAARETHSSSETGAQLPRDERQLCCQTAIHSGEACCVALQGLGRCQCLGQTLPLIQWAGRPGQSPHLPEPDASFAHSGASGHTWSIVDQVWMWPVHPPSLSQTCPTGARHDEAGACPMLPCHQLYY